MAEPAAFAVNPEEAIAFFRQKLNLPTLSWTDLWQGMHSRAFVVAGATSAALLADFRNAIDKAISEGKSLGWFRQEFDRIVAAHGWTYRGSPGWRSAVIFNTNLRMAYATGRWAQIKRLAERRPYLRYVAVMDARTRPLHREWHNTVLRWDDAWWRTHFPPNGWNCRCSIQQLSERDLARLGLRVSPAAPASPLVQRKINTPEGVKYIEVPKGIDPGFAYNPGEAAFGRGADLMAIEKHGAWRPLTGPRPPAMLPLLPADVPKQKPLADLPVGEAQLRQALAAALGGDEAVLSDPIGTRISVGQAVIDHWLEDVSRLGGRERYLPLIPELIADPFEIWAGWAVNEASGRVGLRRRYVKLVDIGRGRVIALVADADGGHWSGFTFLIGGLTGAKNLRAGLLLYRRPD